MRILWVKAGGFLPLDLGGRIRSYHTVKEIARKWQTTAITFYPEERDDKNPLFAPSVDRLITVPLKQRPAPLIYAGALLTNQPFMFQKFCTPKVRAIVRDELRNNRYDVIICDFLVGCGVVPFSTPIPKVVFTHNVEAKIWERHYEVAANLPRRLVAQREWNRLKALEIGYLSQAELVLTVSDVDRSEFINWGLPGERIYSVPTGVDVEFFHPQPQRELPRTIVFTGAMDWMPNQDGIQFFLSEIYPKIVEEIPDLRLKIVGRKPPQSIVAAAAKWPGVTVTGWVEDVREHVAEAQLCIVPLRVGSGTRLKIFEAMAMAKAVVSTTIGAEGLPVSNGKNIAVADLPKDFAARVIELLQDESRRQRMAQAARNMVESRYSWGAVTGQLMNTIQSHLSLQPIQK